MWTCAFGAAFSPACEVVSERNIFRCVAERQFQIGLQHVSWSVENMLSVMQVLLSPGASCLTVQTFCHRIGMPQFQWAKHQQCIPEELFKQLPLQPKPRLCAMPKPEPPATAKRAIDQVVYDDQEEIDISSVQGRWKRRHVDTSAVDLEFPQLNAAPHLQSTARHQPGNSCDMEVRLLNYKCWSFTTG